MTREEALKQKPEPVYFPPCVDCQNRSKEILTAYDNMKKMQAYTKEEVITMLGKIRAEINKLTAYYTTKDKGINLISQKAVNRIFDKYKAKSEGKE